MAGIRVMSVRWTSARTAATYDSANIAIIPSVLCVGRPFSVPMGPTATRAEIALTCAERRRQSGGAALTRIVGVASSAIIQK